MSEIRPLRKQLEAIQAEEAFDDLSSFRDPTTWKSMTTDERELLGLLFLKHAEKQLELGDSNVLNSINMAARVAPQSAEVHYRQGLLYLTQDQNVRCLLEASKALKKAVEINPLLVNAWKAWGDSLIKLGLLNEDSQSFFEATQTFAEGESHLLNSVNDPQVLSLYYWNWGLACYYLGRHSEEASDFIHSIDKFSTSEKYFSGHPEFYFDFGKVYLELGHLMRRSEYLLEALRYFQESLLLAPENYSTVMALGCTSQQLFEHQFDPESYSSARMYFERASHMRPDDPVVWMRWGMLESMLAKLSQDEDFLVSAHQKFSSANALEPGNSLIQSQWADVEIILGSRTENLDLLNDAKAKIIHCVEEDPENHAYWYLYGLCIYELGRYFLLEPHFHEAINKFNHALSIQPNFIPAWHGKAMTTCALADFKREPSLFDRALRLFSKAHELGANGSSFLNDWGAALMKQAELTREVKLLEMALEKFESAIGGRTLDGQGLGPDPEWIFNLGCGYDFYADITGNVTYIEKAIQMLQHVVDNEPHFYAARYNLALAYAHLGEVTSDVDILRQSLEHFEIFLQHNPEDDNAWNDCGLMLMDLAHLVCDPTVSSECRLLLQQAEHKLYQAIGLGCVEALFNMACVQSMLGNHDSAMHYLHRAETANHLPHSEDLLLEPWLEDLRGTLSFREFIGYLRTKEKDSQ